MNDAEKRKEWGTCGECGYLEGTNSACFLCHFGYPTRSQEHDQPIEP